MKKYLLFICIFLSVFSSKVFSQEFQGILLGTHDAGIFKKLVQSNDWIPINNGLPRLNGGYPEVVGIFPVNEMEFYCILKNYGIYHTNNGGYLWESRNYGLPLTFIKSDNDKNNYLVSKITSFSIHPKNPEILLITTKFQIFYSNDGGKHWHELDLFNRKSNFFVTSAFVPIEDLNILIGTAYNGLFSYDLHENVKLIKNDLPKEPYDKWQSIFFHEEIQSILISSKDNNKIYVGTGFGNGLWYSGNAGKNWKKLPFTTDEKFFNIFSIQEFDSENILVESDDEYYLLAIDDFNTKPFQIKEYFEKLPKTLKPVLAVEFSSSKGKIEYRNKHRVRVTSKYYERAKDKNGIYLNAYKANIEYFKKNIDNIKKNNINSVI
ncbi:MAG: hypothetical protein PHV06_01860, partial [bacterium]|nr:hypothetical protein [bacterium]